MNQILNLDFSAESVPFYDWCVKNEHRVRLLLKALYDGENNNDNGDKTRQIVLDTTNHIITSLQTNLSNAEKIKLEAFEKKLTDANAREQQLLSELFTVEQKWKSEMERLMKQEKASYDAKIRYADVEKKIAIDEAVADLKADISAKDIERLNMLDKISSADARAQLLVQNSDVAHMEKLRRLTEENDRILAENSSRYRLEMKTLMDENNMKISALQERVARSLDTETALKADLEVILNAERVKHNEKVDNLQNKLDVQAEAHKKQLVETQVAFQERTGQFLDKYMSAASSVKGKAAENSYERLLSETFPTAEIINTSGTTASCDIRMRKDNVELLFEIKNYAQNVPSSEVMKFIRDVKLQKVNGLMVSVVSGIATKANFQVDLVDGKYLVMYLTTNKHDMDAIKIAVNVLQYVSELKCQDADDKGLYLSKEKLALITREILTIKNINDESIENTKRLLLTLQKQSLSQLKSLLGLIDVKEAIPKVEAPKAKKDLIPKNKVGNEMTCCGTKYSSSYWYNKHRKSAHM